MHERRFPGGFQRRPWLYAVLVTGAVGQPMGPVDQGFAFRRDWPRPRRFLLNTFSQLPLAFDREVPVCHSRND